MDKPAISAEGAEPTFGTGIANDYQFAAFKSGVSYDQALSVGNALLERGWSTLARTESIESQVRDLALEKFASMESLAQPEGAESVALPPLEFTPEERDSIYSAESENYYTLKCRERQLRAEIAANARLRADKDEIKAQRDEAIAAVRELDPAWEAQWKRATKAEAELAAAQAELKAMTEDRDLWREDHGDDCPYKERAEAAETSLARVKGEA